MAQNSAENATKCKKLAKCKKTKIQKKFKTLFGQAYHKYQGVAHHIIMHMPRTVIYSS